MNKLTMVLLVWSSLGFAAPRCTFEFGPGLFFEAHVDETAKRILLSGPHQTYEAPYAKESNPSGETWFAAFGKSRTMEITQNAEGLKVCLDDRCHACK